ncbi:hypothetical protein Hamer_G006161 [Homarus americanus]|uniref:Uncharacterized protein n=1 Tax=Homarus americanus TaxID=6706 RepID=A0A8J5MM81_HOMAM|nr:hypothetical protein Hamer_G006161 [Homarus americanus]
MRETQHAVLCLTMSASTVNQETCPICREDLDVSDVVDLRQKGAHGINSASVQRGDDVVVSAGEKVHITCRKRTIVTPRGASFSYVKTDTFVQTILECCDSRSDEWAFTVKGRIEYYGCDLHAADCIYHRSCSGNFRSGLSIPLQFQNVPEAKRRKSGQPKNEDQEQAFMNVCSYLYNNDEEQLTISHLREKMKEFLANTDSEPYENQYLKGQLKEQYGDNVHFAEGEGLYDIVTMREKTAQILRFHFNIQAKDKESQRQAIIETAARLIKSDIKSNVPSLTDQYPSAKSLKLDSALSFVPDTLQMLLNGLFVGKETSRKVAGIGHAIVQAVRPRAVVAPLQVGLAVQVHHMYRSQFLVDTLHEMGFSSYKEVMRFEKNAADSVAPDMNPVDWGWKLEDNQFVPVMTKKTAVPESLLQIVHCLTMSASTVNQETCPICREDLDVSDVVDLRQKGAHGINSASVQRGDDVVVSAGEKVHITCRKRTIVTPRGASFSYVKTDTFVQTILECCDSRSDEWAFTVKGRIEYYGCDLHAADCIYHRSCSGNFRSGLSIPLQFQNVPEAKRRKSGQPKNEDQEQAFMNVCSYLYNNDEEQLTISHLREKMKEFLANTDSEPYENQYLKGQLKEQYGDNVHFAEGEGLYDIVTMREKTAQILRFHFNIQAKDKESQRQAIIETAARLIKSDIKSNVPSLTDQYPSAKSLKLDSALSFVPDTLQMLLNGLFVGKETSRKVAGIGHAIVQAVRPRAVVAPLQVGLAVQVHHMYRSQFLVDTLHEMGFSSYKEVMRFEKNAADSVAPDMNPVDWGWKLEDNQFVPVMTKKTAVPESLLQIVHCNCTTACRTRCSCRGYGLPCTPACGPCQIENCENWFPRCPKQGVRHQNYLSRMNNDGVIGIFIVWWPYFLRHLGFCNSVITSLLF